MTIWKNPRFYGPMWLLSAASAALVTAAVQRRGIQVELGCYDSVVTSRVSDQGIDARTSCAPGAHATTEYHWNGEREYVTVRCNCKAAPVPEATSDAGAPDVSEVLR